MKPIIPFALVCLGGIAACTPVASPGAAGETSSARECFFVSQVQSFASDDNDTVYVRTGRNEVYRLNTMACGNVDWGTSIGIRARGGGTSVCSGLDADLVVPDASGMGQRTCPVTGVRRLTDAEVAALPERDRP